MYQEILLYYYNVTDDNIVTNKELYCAIIDHMTQHHEDHFSTRHGKEQS